MHNHVKKILITQDQIIEKTKEIAQQINEDFKGERITLVALLSGSVPFLAELMKHIKLDCEIDFMDVSSYRGTKSTGEVRILKDLTRPIDSCNVIIVEDIVDTGKTLNVVKGILENRDPKALKIVTLLDKPEGREVDCYADYVGFSIPNEFVIGFGLDYDELYRNLPYVGVLREECYM
ncbi:hypoxanthine phosphoribosyltransferase [Erysipelotrichaceae bacterium OttesenSCG-928-M19]|nr:hypoxanthine phosphoribosyltransferase [Erysipelotrichaceae bacterium OttesenSCG-928-M19]